MAGMFNEDEEMTTDNSMNFIQIRFHEVSIVWDLLNNCELKTIYHSQQFAEPDNFCPLGLNIYPANDDKSINCQDIAISENKEASLFIKPKPQESKILSENFSLFRAFTNLDLWEI